MSIATRTGDSGTTGLMYNRRLSKNHPRVEAYGSVDELNTALGLVRAHCGEPDLNAFLMSVQKTLVDLMGELATQGEDLDRYEKDGFRRITDKQVEPLDAKVAELESENINFKGWATPGSCPCSAFLDNARTACRLAERRVCGLLESGDIENDAISVYLNRLSDLLWLFARWVETNGN
jgi:cob(I)alamin adenosyltransferase